MEIWTGQQGAYGSLQVCQCGREACAPGHQFGPAVRDHYLIHFVASGHGTLWAEDTVHALEPGQVFIIFPGQRTTYRASESDPWTYMWVGYSGADAEAITAQVGLTRGRPVASCQDAAAALALLAPMTEIIASYRLGALAVLGNLCQFLAVLGQWLPHAEPNLYQTYYHKAMWYMEGHYSLPITIEDVAAFVGLSRSQLFRVFKRVSGASPKASLSAVRLRRARGLLRDTDLTAGEIAASVGIASAARLGVLCKQAYGKTPSQCRQKEGEEGRTLHG